MRVIISVTRPATLIRQRRIVSNWASRQNDAWGFPPQHRTKLHSTKPA
jgi:hypothetical protein